MAKSKAAQNVTLDAHTLELVREYAKEVELDDLDAAACDLIHIAAGRRAALAKYAAKPKKKRAAKK